MSKHVYSVFEYVDSKTGEWTTANLYEKHEDGTYGIAQLIVGNSEYLSALTGDEPFDFPLDNDGNIVDNLVDPLEHIAEIISYASSGGITSNASPETKQYYQIFKLSGWDDSSANIQYPGCVTYTLRDMDMIEMLAKAASSKATRFYNKYFARIRWLMDTILRMEYTTNGSDVRVIIWGY